MYFIESGEVRVTITKDGQEKEVSRVKTGSYFGEMALVENVPRSASVYAVGSGEDGFSGAKLLRATARSVSGHHETQHHDVREKLISVSSNRFSMDFQPEAETHDSCFELSR